MKNAVKYKLSIPAPCPQDWNKMPDSGQGKYCDTCNRNLIDFSHLTDTELAIAIENMKGKVCGRYRKDQLDKFVQKPTKQTESDALKPVLAALLLAASSQAAAESNSEGNSINKSVQTTINQSKTPINTTCIPQPVDTSKHLLIKVTVIDSITGEAMPFVSVKILETDQLFITNENGIAEVSIKQESELMDYTFNYSYVGYLSQQRKFTSTTLNNYPSIKLYFPEHATAVLGAMVIVQEPVKVRRPWYKFWQKKEK